MTTIQITMTQNESGRTECPHCRKQIPDDMITDDLSGCPLTVKCESPPGYLAAADAWPTEEDGDDDQEDGAPLPVMPAPVFELV
jgi:hypothetical protein